MARRNSATPPAGSPIASSAMPPLTYTTERARARQRRHGPVLVGPGLPGPADHPPRKRGHVRREAVPEELGQADELAQHGGGGLHAAVPRVHLRLEPIGSLADMTLSTGARHALRLVGNWTRYRNGVIRACVADRMAYLRFLQIRHMTGHAATPSRVGSMMRVRLRTLRLALVARRALTVARAVR